MFKEKGIFEIIDINNNKISINLNNIKRTNQIRYKILYKLKLLEKKNLKLDFDNNIKIIKIK